MVWVGGVNLGRISLFVWKMIFINLWTWTVLSSPCSDPGQQGQGWVIDSYLHIWIRLSACRWRMKTQEPPGIHFINISCLILSSNLQALVCWRNNKVNILKIKRNCSKTWHGINKEKCWRLVFSYQFPNLKGKTFSDILRHYKVSHLLNFVHNPRACLTMHNADSGVLHPCTQFLRNLQRIFESCFESLARR